VVVQVTRGIKVRRSPGPYKIQETAGGRFTNEIEAQIIEARRQLDEFAVAFPDPVGFIYITNGGSDFILDSGCYLWVFEPVRNDQDLIWLCGQA